MSHSIDIVKLRKIIREELARATINEDVDHKAISDVVSSASKLLDAINTFKEKAPDTVKAAINVHIEPAVELLENMLKTPDSYVTKPVAEPKVVHLVSQPKKEA